MSSFVKEGVNLEGGSSSGASTSGSGLKHVDPQATSSPTESQSSEGGPGHVYVAGGGRETGNSTHSGGFWLAP